MSELKTPADYERWAVLWFAHRLCTELVSQVQRDTLESAASSVEQMPDGWIADSQHGDMPVPPSQEVVAEVIRKLKPMGPTGPKHG